MQETVYREKHKPYFQCIFCLAYNSFVQYNTCSIGTENLVFFYSSSWKKVVHCARIMMCVSLIRCFEMKRRKLLDGDGMWTHLCFLLFLELPFSMTCYHRKMAVLAKFPWATLTATCIVSFKTGSSPERCHLSWCPWEARLLRALSLEILQQLLQLTRPCSAWCLLVLLLVWLFAVDSHCFLLKFNSVCIWKDKGANLLFLLETKLYWRLDDDPLLVVLQNPTKWARKHKGKEKYSSDLPNSLRIIRRLAVWHCLWASCELNSSPFSLYISACHFGSGFHILRTPLTLPAVNIQDCLLLREKWRSKRLMWHWRLSNRQPLKCGHKYLQFTYWVEMNRFQFAFMNASGTLANSGFCYWHWNACKQPAIKDQSGICA